MNTNIDWNRMTKILQRGTAAQADQTEPADWQARLMQRIAAGEAPRYGQGAELSGPRRESSASSERYAWGLGIASLGVCSVLLTLILTTTETSAASDYLSFDFPNTTLIQGD